MMSVLWWPIIAGLGAFAMLIALLVFLFWIWMIVDVAKRHFKNDAEKIVWILVVVLAGWLGALVYFIIIRSTNPNGLMRK
ncbi:PLDc N-terminal domain-containing protein [Candidatus Pacearchaeota archaeon]|nr:PLDc N-terminal domain-containing protein [Candidatus Pacearchaeota archaeon]